MRKLYSLIILLCCLLANERLLAQCAVTISTNTSTTQINCKYDAITLTANATGSGAIKYLWSTGKNDSFINVYDSAVYTVTITDDLGCTSSSSIIITKDSTRPSVVPLAFPDTICVGGSSTLICLGADTYFWQPGSQTASYFTVSPASTTTYTVAGTAGNGCSDTGSIVIFVRPLPLASISGDLNICQYAAPPQVTFTGSNGTAPYTFAYTVNGGPTQTVTTTGSNNSVAVSVPTGNLDVLQYNLVSVTDSAGCAQLQNGTATITISSGITFKSARTASVCNHTPFSYTAISSAGSATFSWIRPAVDSISNLPGSDSSASINDTLYNTGTQPKVVTYFFTFSLGSGCTATDSLKVTVNPSPVITSLSDTTFCNGAFASQGIPLTSSAAGATISWKNNNPAIGLPASGNGNILPFNARNITKNPVTATITVYAAVQAGSISCADTASTSFTITVRPAAILTSTKDTSICNNAPFSYRARSSDTTTKFIWSRPHVDSVSNQAADSIRSADINEALHNTGSQPKVVTYFFTMSTPGFSCAPTDSVKVTVNPTPKINLIGDTTFCNGFYAVGGIPILSSPAGAVISWTNSDTTIGLPARSSGSIFPFIATNTTRSPKTAIVKVQAYVQSGRGNCADSVNTSFKITVMPAPVLISSKTASICNMATFTYKAKSSNDSTKFSWTRQAVPGIHSPDVSSGINDSLSQTLINDTTQPVVVKYFFTLSTGTGCAPTDSVLVTVNPTPRITRIDSTTYCNGFFVRSGIPIITSPSGATITWTNSNPSIGLPADSSGSIFPFIATNTTRSPKTATIKVLAFVQSGSTGCADTAVTSFKITVLPAPVLTSTKDTSICNDVPILYMAKSSDDSTKFSWTRPAVAGIRSPDISSGNSASITNALHNDTPQPVGVKYLFTLSTGSGCHTADSVNITVNPTPEIAHVNDTTYCNDVVAQPILLSCATNNAVLTWTCDPFIGFGTPDTIINKENLGKIPAFSALNKRNDPVNASVMVKSFIGNGCKGDSVNFHIVVYPTPALTSTRDTIVCNDVSFKYNAGSTANGTKFNLIKRTFGNSLSYREGTGTTDNINDILHNGSDQPQVLTYQFTLSTGGKCFITDSLKVTVNPTPVINTGIRDTTFCNGAAVNGIRFSSPSPNAAFKWTSDVPVGFGSSGSDSIPTFTATNTGTTPVVAHIAVGVSIAAGKVQCAGTDSLHFTITVNPSPPRPGFTSTLSRNPDDQTLVLCNGTDNINFNASAPAQGIDYRWTSPANAAAVSIRNPKSANTVISFHAPGTNTIQLTATDTARGHCSSTVAQVVNVLPQSAGVDALQKIFKMQPGNLLVYPDNTLTGYQWGYDSVYRAISDSLYSPPVAVPGQVYQFFVPDNKFLTGDSLNANKYLYWVLLKKGDCYTRVYYNGPYDDPMSPVIPVSPDDSTIQLQIIPNPNSGTFEIALKGNIYGNINAQIYNATGQVVLTQRFEKVTPVVKERFTINNLPGLYFIVMYSSDLKKVTSRFIIQR